MRRMFWKYPLHLDVVFVCEISDISLACEMGGGPLFEAMNPSETKECCDGSGRKVGDHDQIQ
jgi:hypothetical protein